MPTASPATADPLAAFARALRDPGLPAPAGLRCWNGSDPTARLAVHRNTVRVSLTQALADGFPAMRRALGDAAFAALAADFLQAHPPTSPVLTAWGDALPGHLQAGWVLPNGAAAAPWLPDLARLERLRVLACHAANAPALSADALARHLNAPERLPQALVALHPSLGVCISAHPVVSVWQALQAPEALEATQTSPPAPGSNALQHTCSEQTPPAWQPTEPMLAQGPQPPAALPPLPAEGEAALVLRVQEDVLVLRLPLPAAGCVQALRQGQLLGAAAAALQDGAGPWGLAETLALLIRQQAIVGWTYGG